MRCESGQLNYSLDNVSVTLYWWKLHIRIELYKSFSQHFTAYCKRWVTLYLPTQEIDFYEYSSNDRVCNLPWIMKIDFSEYF